MMLRPQLFLLLFACLSVSAGWETTIRHDSTGTITHDGQNVIELLPGLHLAPNWGRLNFNRFDIKRLETDKQKHGIIESRGLVFTSDLEAEQTAPDTIRLHYRLTTKQDVSLNSFHVAFMLPSADVIGKTFSVPDTPPQTIPLEFTREHKHLYDGRQRQIVIQSTHGPLTFRFPQPTIFLLQDNRNWTDGFELRVNHDLTHNPDATAWKAGDFFDVVIDIVLPGETTFEQSHSVTLSNNSPEWVNIVPRVGVKAGSAVDFSGIIKRDAPAGKHGRVIPKGENFEFEKLPGVPQRFYGVNLVGTANTPPTHEQAIELAERFCRLGYNTVRFHHYGNAIYDRKAEHSWELDPVKLERLDFLFSELKKRGFYITTDIYSSRNVKAADIYDGVTGDLSFQEFRQALPFNAKAMEHYKRFARNFFLHKNPYTGLTYAEDTALFAVCVVNEGNASRFGPGNAMSQNTVDLWVKAWNEWLVRKYGNAQKRNAAWKMPQLPEVLPSLFASGDNPQGLVDFQKFSFEVEKKLYADIKSFVRNELGCQAMLTNMNHVGFSPSEIKSRLDFDYVDQHFYVDHPRFLTPVRWALPLAINNDDVVRSGNLGGLQHALTRFYDRPFTVTEFNYSYPSQHRGVGGILTGCLGSIQNWAGIYRFAYSHGGGNIYKPSRMGHFDLASDPLNQAADRATVCLYLRGDLQSVDKSIAIAFPDNYADAVPAAQQVQSIRNPWMRYGLFAKLGAVIGGSQTSTDIAMQYSPDAPQGKASFRSSINSQDALQFITRQIIENHWLPEHNRSDIQNGIRRLQTANSQFDIDFINGKFTLDTQLTAGGYAEAGQRIDTSSLDIAIATTPATVWASSLDGAPLAISRRILLTHLTDVQNNGITFAEAERRTMLKWGGLPLIARIGQADVIFKRSANAPALRAWAIATDGERLAELPLLNQNNTLILHLDVKGPEGARMMYELAE